MPSARRPSPRAARATSAGWRPGLRRDRRRRREPAEARTTSIARQWKDSECESKFLSAFHPSAFMPSFSHRSSPSAETPGGGPSRRRWAAPAGTNRQAIDFGGIGDFGQRLRAGGAGGNQQQLVAAAEQMRLLAIGQRRRPSTSNASVGSSAAARRRRPAKRPNHHEEDSQAPAPGCRTPLRRRSPSGFLSGSVRLADFCGFSAGNGAAWLGRRSRWFGRGRNLGRHRPDTPTEESTGLSRSPVAWDCSVILGLFNFSFHALRAELPLY